MLAVYTFVFSIVFNARWGAENDSKTGFALILFCGLIVFNLFSDVLVKSPTLITANINLVKKIVFPLEILPIVAMGSALFHALINFLIWALACSIFSGIPPLTSLLLPLTILPIIFITLGSSWLLSSIGVYFRDINQMVNVVVTVLMFLSPLFFPLKSLPLEYQKYFLINPITPAIDMTRMVLIWDVVPDPLYFINYFSGALAFSWLGYVFFQKTRKGFADVL
jgi:lipopolysaccharide transport system permease protein